MTDTSKSFARETLDQIRSELANTTPAVERFNPDTYAGSCWMENDPEGDYVRYSDYVDIEDELKTLSDPNAVHINMLHGRIAKPSVEQIVHIYAGKVRASADYAALSSQLTAANRRLESLRKYMFTAKAAGKAEGLWEAAGCIGHITRHEDLGAILALIPADTPVANVTVQEAAKVWQWWAGANEEWFTVGPCDTKEQAINEAVNDGIGEWLDEAQDPPSWMQSFEVVEARQDPLKLSDWIGADWMLERANEALADSDRVSCENDDRPWFEVNHDQEADLINRIKTSCDDWQAAHGLVFHSATFSHQRNSETVTHAIAGGRDD